MDRLVLHQKIESLRRCVVRIQLKCPATAEFTDYVERYQLFLLIAFVLFIAGLGLSNRRGAWFTVKRSQKSETRSQNAEVKTQDEAA